MSGSILVVEDEKDLQNVYQLVLKSSGYDVDTAANGQAALEKVGEKEPDLILLDLYMPVMGGKDFLTAFDKSRYPHTKIIVYTNLSDPTTKAEIMSLGAEKLVLKADMGPAELIAMVQEALAES